MCLSVSVYERQCTDDPPEKNLVFLWIYCAWRKCYGAAFLTGLTGNLWIGIQIQLTGCCFLEFYCFTENRKSAPGSFCKHPFDSFHRSGDFSGELPACTGGV